VSSSDEIEVFETAMMAHPVGLPDSAACFPGWQWLTPAVEMAAAVSGTWPVGRGRRSAGWGASPRIATRTQGADAGSIATAREFTCATLRRWGVADRREDIVVVVSELLSNAQRHALPYRGAVWPRWSIRLGLLQARSSVLCAVSDPSIGVPALREPGFFEETGRGLHVVASLSDHWGYTAPGPGGKVVWATFSTGPFWRPLQPTGPALPVPPTASQAGKAQGTGPRRQ
jgi:anti-sigma regulatory factor (Ser/Thr protein kinase)